MVTICAACSTATKTAEPNNAAVSSANASRPDWAEHSFDRLFIEELERAFAGATVQKMAELAYRVHGEAPAVNFEFSAHKAHSSCVEDWSTCQDAVDHTLAAIGQTTTLEREESLAPSQIRIVLRSAAKIASVKSRRASVQVRPFSVDASWLLAADLPSTIRLSVSLDELGLSWDQAWALAKKNLEPTFANAVTKATDQFIVYQDGYAPSAMLFPSHLKALAKREFPHQTGKLLAVAPEENILLYTIGGSAQAALLREVAGGAGAGSNFALSTHVMEWDGSAWHAAK